MGTDIHLHVERKTENGWEEIAPYSRNADGTFTKHEAWEGRNYELFDALCGGTRGMGYNSIDSARGIPDDVSAEVAKDYAAEQDWCYNFSWLDAIELINFMNSDKAMSDLYSDDDDKQYNFMENFVHEILYVGNLYDVYWVSQPNKLRIVFWFDN